jgi:hypothetical protein
MDLTADELAGVVDLFGALRRAELETALAELAFKQGETVAEAAFADAIDEAVSAYVLVEYEPADGDAAAAADDTTPGDDVPTAADDATASRDGVDAEGPLLAVGPTAFPTQPPHAEDLPHILDYERRSVDRERAADQLLGRLRREAALAVDDADHERIADLFDRCYDVELWADVETDALREALAAELPQD